MTESFNCEYRIAGAGIAGLLLASRLARSGRKVLVLDQGPSISEAERSNLLQGVRRDFAYGADYNDHLGAQTVTRTRPATDGEVAEYGYERLFGVGGTALHFQGLMLRPVEADMEVRSRFGYGRDWPISYDELEPGCWRPSRRWGSRRMRTIPTLRGARGPSQCPDTLSHGSIVRCWPPP